MILFDFDGLQVKHTPCHETSDLYENGYGVN